MKPEFNRILLKFSGEALLGDQEYGIDPKVLRFIAEEVKTVFDLGVSVGLVVGGGNIFRGVQASEAGIDRVSGDHMGMLATLMNAIALQNMLETVEVPTRLQSAIRMAEIAEPFIRRKAIRHLEKGRVVIFGAGTGNPYFTTDTAAALRATEIEAEILIKGTKVDGIYDKDPMKNDDAVKYDSVSYREAINKQLRVMDLTAVTLAEENAMPIAVYDMSQKGALLNLVCGQKVGTLVTV